MDTQLFFAINHLPHTNLTDAVAAALSGAGTAGMIWFIIALIMFLREEKKDHWFFAPFLFAGGASYLISEIILKPLVGRVRPSLEMGAIIVGTQSNDPSFPSGHATIAFAMATVLSRVEPRWKLWLYLVATLIALSRVFLGQHYPLDVLAGSLLGWGIGIITLFAVYVRGK